MKSNRSMHTWNWKAVFYVAAALQVIAWCLGANHITPVLFGISMYALGRANQGFAMFAEMGSVLQEQKRIIGDVQKVLDKVEKIVR